MYSCILRNRVWSSYFILPLLWSAAPLALPWAKLHCGQSTRTTRASGVIVRHLSFTQIVLFFTFEARASRLDFGWWYVSACAPAAVRVTLWWSYITKKLYFNARTVKREPPGHCRWVSSCSDVSGYYHDWYCSEWSARMRTGRRAGWAC